MIGHGLPAALHVKHLAFGAVSLVSASAAGGAALGNLGSIIGGLVAFAALIGGFVQAGKRRVDAAEKRGCESRNDEIRQLKSELRTTWDQMEFYRSQYSTLLQRSSGAPVEPVPPIPKPSILQEAEADQ